jgi:hypothetical protein
LQLSPASAPVFFSPTEAEPEVEAYASLFNLPRFGGAFLLESFTFRDIREADCKIVMPPNRPHIQFIADSTLGRQRLRDTLAPSEER